MKSQTPSVNNPIPYVTPKPEHINIIPPIIYKEPIKQTEIILLQGINHFSFIVNKYLIPLLLNKIISFFGIYYFIYKSSNY